MCVCSPGYEGDDCSLEVTDIVLSTAQTSQTLTSKRWHYYRLQATSGVSGLQVRVAQSSALGDVDLYVKKGSIPSRSDYLLREVTGQRAFSLDVNSTLFSGGEWYFGCYAFSTVTFDITVVPLSGCPNACSGHGECDGSVCNCDSGFSGEDCSDGYVALQMGQPEVSTQLKRLEWVYYTLDVAADQASFIVQTTQSSANEDVDLYIRFNAVPTKTSFDFRDISSNLVSNVTVPDPRDGRYFIGVFAYADTTFTINALATPAIGNVCASDCSGSVHGSCSAGSCQCSQCFEGDYCESAICQWDIGEAQQGAIDSNAWNFYSFNVQTGNALVVRVTEDRMPGALADCDLYIRRGEKPSVVQFDYSDFGRGLNSSVTLDSPMGLYWVGVYGFHRCSYTAMLEEGTNFDCPNSCSGHGTCDQGDCVCVSPWSGDDCSVSESGLTNGVTVSDTVTLNQWKYFNFTSTAAFVTVQARETATVGSIWLFVAYEQPPTLADHDFQDINFSSAMHSVDIERSDPEDSTPQTYFVGVYGDPIISTSAGTGFDLVAWSPTKK